MPSLTADTYVQLVSTVHLVVLIQPHVQQERIPSIQAVKVEQIACLVKLIGTTICQAKGDAKSVVRLQPHLEGHKRVSALAQTETLLRVSVHVCARQALSPKTTDLMSTALKIANELWNRFATPIRLSILRAIVLLKTKKSSSVKFNAQAALEHLLKAQVSASAMHRQTSMKFAIRIARKQCPNRH